MIMEPFSEMYDIRMKREDQTANTVITVFFTRFIYCIATGLLDNLHYNVFIGS